MCGSGRESILSRRKKKRRSKLTKPNLVLIVNKNVPEIEERFTTIEMKFSEFFGDFCGANLGRTHTQRQKEFLRQAMNYLADIQFNQFVIMDKIKPNAEDVAELYSRMKKWAEWYGLDVEDNPLSAIYD